MNKLISNKNIVGKTIIFLLFNVITFHVNGQFITTWKTDNIGTSNDDQITIPATGAGYNYDIAWEEVGNPTNSGTEPSGQTGSYTITFPSVGTYQITITGTFPRIYFNNGGDRDKILTVEQWGSNPWASMASAFYGCSNLTINDTSAPVLGSVIDMSNMFRGCSVMDSDINNWNVVTVENMSGLFRDATLFNQPLNNWTVNNVTDMSYMFFAAESFDQPIGTWRTDNVTTMRYMFGGAKAFNQYINYVAGVGYWNTSNVTDMVGLFQVAESFNQPLDQWDVSNVTNFGGMFNGALVFNQNINVWVINTVSSVSMNAMFSNATAFNQPLGSWDVSMVTNMASMFSGATAFNQDLSTWDTRVSNVTSMNSMFAFTSFNQDVIDWDVSNVTDFNGMFQGNTAFNQDISNWSIKNSGSIDMRSMFSGATSFDQDLGNWNISFLRYAVNMLNNSGLSVENYDNLLIGWAAQTLTYPSVNFGAKGLYYCSGEAARTTLVTLGWFITDEGQGCIATYEGADTSGPQILNGQSTAVDFGSGAQGIGKTQSITVENRLATDITNFDVSISGSAFSITSPSLPTTITAGSTLTLDIFLDGTVVDVFTETVSLTSDDFTSYSFQITGTITATVQPEIKVFEGSNPFGTEITYGDVTGYLIGQEDRGIDATNQITILNNGSATLNVTDITFSGTAFSANPTNFTVPVDGSQTVDITLDGSTGGFFSETMNIASDDVDENPFDFLVEGNIYGPELVVIDGTSFYSDPHISNGQPAPLELGTAIFDTNIFYQVSITNNGPVSLTVSDISISGTSFGNNASLPFVIPGEVDGVYSYATFDIILNGSITGSFTETVTITSDDDTNPTYVFDVTGDVSDPNAPKVYWTNFDTDINNPAPNEINRMNLDGSAYEQYHSETNYLPRGIAVDKQNKIIYWTNEWGQIKKGTISAIGLTSVTDFINDMVDTPREMNGVALDVTSGKIYWASTYDGAIKSADLADPDPISTVQTIVSGLAYPIGVAVNPAGKIYYTDNDNNGGADDNTATLHQVNLDGSNDMVLSTTTQTGQQYTYRDVKLDVGNNRIYWSGGNDDIYSPFGEIYYANISDVSGTETSFITLNDNPWGIDLDLVNNKVYWVDRLVYMVEPRIGRADLDGTNAELIHTGYSKGVIKPLFIALDVAAPSPLNILSHTPASNSQSIAANANIVLNFDNNVDAATLNNSNILIKGEQSGIISGAFSGGGTSAITFNPTNDFKIGDNIQVTLTTGIQSTGGGPLADDYFFSFEVQTGPAPETPPLLVEHTIYDDGTNTGVDRVVAIDINKDGNLDLAAIYEGIDDGIAWYQNDGTQVFTRNVAATPTMTDSQSIYAADLDQDGDIDLFSAFNGVLNWYENDGAFNFTEHFIYQTGVGFGLSDMRVVDMDGDGDLDVVGAYSTSATDFIRWHENDGSQNFTSSPVIVSGINNPQGLEVADIDSDGDVDIFAGGSDDDIAWYENDGNQNFTSHLTTPTSMTSQYSGFTIGDFNGDGFIDMALATTTETSWFANDGTGNFTENPISTSVGGSDLEAADLDGDGDMDLIGGQLSLRFYENDGTGNFTIRSTSTSTTIEDVFTADLDSDGDLDVIAGGQGSKVVWFENTANSACSNPPIANAGTDLTICESDVANLSGSFGGGATSITWTTSGDGSFGDNTSTTAIYTPGTNDISNGSVTLTLTTDDPDGTGPCTAATDDLILSIDLAPIANAGADQIICSTDVVSLSGVIGGSASGATWTTSGDGTFDDATSLNATYTPGSTDITNSTITLTLSTSSANCPVVTDNLVVDFNQPISAIDQTETLKVGETIIINSLNGATVNTGDIITTVILVDPQKGTVTVNTDGTINYTASQGNVGPDSFDFQICNQCNLCSTATANITIQNDAPTFNGTTTSASPGAPVSIDIIGLMTDVNGNIDLSSITIIQQPTSGAVASLDANNNLIVDYTGVIFFGTDEVVIEVCDFDGACTEATILIEVSPQPIVAYNAVSPNGDGRHDFLEFQFIEGYPDNEVNIINRWGDVVFSIEGYNNQDKIFEGKANKGSSTDLPTGTYYYTVFYKDVNGNSQSVKGFFELRR